MSADNLPRLIVSNDRPKRDAEIVALPKQLRAEWMDVMAVDPQVKTLDFRLACVIGRFVNGRDGVTFVSRKRLAEQLGVTVRAVETGIKRLEDLGYLKVERRELGTFTTSDGRTVPIAGGRGAANSYRPAFERANVDSSFDRKKLERAFALLTEERANRDSLKGEQPFAPTLNLPSEGNTGRASTCAREAGPMALGAAGERLKARLGEDVFRSWFGQVAFEGASDGELRLSAATKFLRDYIDQHYTGAALAAWAQDHPGLNRCIVTVRRRGSAPAEGGRHG